MNKNPDPPELDPEKKLELQFGFAWEWFSYHADQRLRAFNFALVLMGAVIVGYAAAVREDAEPLGVGLALFGVLVALSFYAMEVRNTELVMYGQNALKEIEPHLGQSIVRDNLARKQLGTSLGPAGRFPAGRFLRARITKAENEQQQTAYSELHLVRGLTHTLWLRILVLSFALLALAGAFWAGFGFPCG